MAQHQRTACGSTASRPAGRGRARPRGRPRSRPRRRRRPARRRRPRTARWSTAIDHLAILAIDRPAVGRLAADTVVVTVMSNLGFRRAMADHGHRRCTPPRSAIATCSTHSPRPAQPRRRAVGSRHLHASSPPPATGCSSALLAARPGRPFAAARWRSSRGGADAGAAGAREPAGGRIDARPWSTELAADRSRRAKRRIAGRAGSCCGRRAPSRWFG